MADKYFGTPSVGNQPAPLSRQEEEALAISNRWREGKTTASKPIAGKNGEVIFVFGAPATVVCAVLQICDVALQEGEQVNSINLGDTARWMVEPAITGRGANEVQHLIIKPLDIGLETSMVVTTNRRTYHMRLKS
ncbi:MAG: TrbG/VirB9 family P-type conjugative transfer protein, partial [Rhodocyclaceae bacterium]|nr:TrbG/VirB9 family P-type conjugative transfer protein [Rhodocyclaceae bacterium]